MLLMFLEFFQFVSPANQKKFLQTSRGKFEVKIGCVFGHAELTVLGFEETFAGMAINHGNVLLTVVPVDKWAKRNWKI